MAVITTFTPVASTIGGILIGLSAVLLMLFNGRIAGISGILARMFPPYAGGDAASAVAFVVGLMAAAAAPNKRKTAGREGEERNGSRPRRYLSRGTVGSRPQIKDLRVLSARTTSAILQYPQRSSQQQRVPPRPKDDRHTGK